MHATSVLVWYKPALLLRVVSLFCPAFWLASLVASSSIPTCNVFNTQLITPPPWTTGICTQTRPSHTRSYYTGTPVYKPVLSPSVCCPASWTSVPVVSLFTPTQTNITVIESVQTKTTKQITSACPSPSPSLLDVLMVCLKYRAIWTSTATGSCTVRLSLYMMHEWKLQSSTAHHITFSTNLPCRPELS